METESVPINAENFNQLLYDVALIKEMLIANQANTEGELTAEDLEFARRTEKAWKEIDEGKYTEHSTEEFFNQIMDGN